MTKDQIKGLKPVAYKGALKSVETYEKALAKGRIVESKTISTFAEKVAPFLNKKGEIKGNLSAKNVAKFNALVDEFKHSEYRSVSRIRKITEQQEKTFIENHAGATTRTVQSIREMIIEANQNKIKLDSSVAIQLADEAEDRIKISSDEFMNIFNEYIQRKKKLTPTGAQGHVGDDDTVKQIQELLNIYEMMETTEDKDKIVEKVRNNRTLAQIRYEMRKPISKYVEAHKSSVKFNKGHLTFEKSLENKKSTVRTAKEKAVRKGKVSTTKRTSKKRK